MVFSPVTKPKIEAWDPSLHYIAWAQPGTLIPVINARRQEDLLPVLDLSYPPKNKHQPARTERPADHDASHHAVKSNLLLDHAFFPGHSPDHANRNSPDVTSKVDVHDPEEPERSFLDLWARHEHEVRRLREEDVEIHTAEKFFAWLDEKTHKTDFEFHVWSRLRKDTENKLRYRLEFCHRKMHTVEYRKPLETLMVTVPDPTYHSAVFPDKPPEVVRTINEPRDEVTRKATFDKILVFDEPRFRLRFPAVVNNGFPERTKLAFKRLAKLIVRSEQQSRPNSDGKGEPGENTSPVPPFDEEEFLPAEHNTAGKRTKSGKKAKGKASLAKNKSAVEEPEDSSGSKGKGTRKLNKQKKSKVFNISEDDGGKASPGLRNLSGATSTKNASGKKAVRSGQAREKASTGLKKSKRKRNYSLLTDSSIDWSIAPVAAKRGAMEHYTKDEIFALQKHTRLTYNFKLKSDGHPDISAPQAAIDGPPLPSPAIIRMIEEVAFNKRWRLTDLFAYGDKDKSWRLNPVKVRHMLDTLGLEQVTEQAITDFFVKLDDFSEQTINFKDVRTAMHAWIKEKRVRKRYCMEIAGETVMAEISPSMASPVPAAHPTESGQEKLQAGASAAKKHVEERNRHLLPVPNEIGTEVCDVPGDICQWNTVFPEEQVLAWRVQQKLEKLYHDKRWLEAKNALKVFGHLRHMNHADEIPVEKEEPPQQIPVQELPLLDRPSAQIEPAATLEDLAKGVVLRMPLLDQMSHTEMHKRLSLSELEKGLQSPIAETDDEPLPKRRHKYQKIMEEEARIHIESPQLNPENSVMEVNSESRQSAEDIPGKEVTARTTRSWILSVLKNDPSNPASQGDASSKVPVEKRMKRSIVANEEERTDRSELDRYLRRRFRILYNPVPVDEEYGDVLEVLKFRAFNKLKESAKEEEERLQAALDPARINDTACQLVSDVENILVDARKNMNASVSISGPAVEQEGLCELKDLKKEEIKKKLLLEAKGLPRTPLTLMDSKTRALAYQVKRLKSALDLQAPDVRKCGSSSSSIAPSSHRSERSATSVCLTGNRTGSQKPNSNQHENRPLTKPDNVKSPHLPLTQPLEVHAKALPRKSSDDKVGHVIRKQPNRRRVLHSTGVEIGFVLDFYFSRRVDHYLKGMDKNIKKQAQKLKITRYQPLRIVERRLIQRQKFTKTTENYYQSVNQDAQALFRKMHQRVEAKNLADMFPDDMLRRVMLRQEDKNLAPISYREAFAKFKTAIEQEFGGRFPNRIPKNKSKRFYSLPTFFPLRENAELLKTTHG